MPHQGAVSESVLSEVGRHVAGGTLFLWENEGWGPSFFYHLTDVRYEYRISMMIELKSINITLYGSL